MLRSMVDTLVATAMFFMVGFVLLINGPRWEGQLLPVGGNFMIVESTRTITGFDISGTFEKFRQCEYLGMVWYRQGTKIARRVSLSVKDQPAGTITSRAPGLQWFGVWALGRPEKAEGPDIYYGVVEHDCHPLWYTATKIGPFELGVEP